eukprot:106154-Chlamydomonas_euryale.AAC.5
MRSHLRCASTPRLRPAKAIWSARSCKRKRAVSTPGAAPSTPQPARRSPSGARASDVCAPVYASVRVHVGGGCGVVSSFTTTHWPVLLLRPWLWDSIP